MHWAGSRGCGNSAVRSGFDQSSSSHPAWAGQPGLLLTLTIVLGQSYHLTIYISPLLWEMKGIFWSFSVTKRPFLLNSAPSSRGQDDSIKVLNATSPSLFHLSPPQPWPCFICLPSVPPTWSQVCLPPHPFSSCEHTWSRDVYYILNNLGNSL